MDDKGKDAGLDEIKRKDQVMGVEQEKSEEEAEMAEINCLMDEMKEEVVRMEEINFLMDEIKEKVVTMVELAEQRSDVDIESSSEQFNGHELNKELNYELQRESVEDDDGSQEFRAIESQILEELENDPEKKERTFGVSQRMHISANDLLEGRIREARERFMRYWNSSLITSREIKFFERNVSPTLPEYIKFLQTAAQEDASATAPNADFIFYEAYMKRVNESAKSVNSVREIEEVFQDPDEGILGFMENFTSFDSEKFNGSCEQLWNEPEAPISSISACEDRTFALQIDSLMNCEELDNLGQLLSLPKSGTGVVSTLAPSDHYDPMSLSLVKSMVTEPQSETCPSSSQHESGTPNLLSQTETLPTFRKPGDPDPQSLVQDICAPEVEDNSLKKSNQKKKKRDKSRKIPQLVVAEVCQPKNVAKKTKPKLTHSLSRAQQEDKEKQGVLYEDLALFSNPHVLRSSGRNSFSAQKKEGKMPAPKVASNCPPKPSCLLHWNEVAKSLRQVKIKITWKDQQLAKAALERGNAKDGISDDLSGELFCNATTKTRSNIYSSSGSEEEQVTLSERKQMGRRKRIISSSDDPEATNDKNASRAVPALNENMDPIGREETDGAETAIDKMSSNQSNKDKIVRKMGQQSIKRKKVKKAKKPPPPLSSDDDMDLDAVPVMDKEDEAGESLDTSLSLLRKDDKASFPDNERIFNENETNGGVLDKDCPKVLNVEAKGLVGEEHLPCKELLPLKVDVMKDKNDKCNHEEQTCCKRNINKMDSGNTEFTEALHDGEIQDERVANKAKEQAKTEYQKPPEEAGSSVDQHMEVCDEGNQNPAKADLLHHAEKKKNKKKKDREPVLILVESENEGNNKSDGCIVNVEAEQGAVGTNVPILVPILKPHAESKRKGKISDDDDYVPTKIQKSERQIIKKPAQKMKADKSSSSQSGTHPKDGQKACSSSKAKLKEDSSSTINTVVPYPTPEVDPKDGLKKFKCVKCTSTDKPRFLKRKDNFKRHYMEYHLPNAEKKSFLCLSCSKEYSLQRDFNAHVRKCKKTKGTEDSEPKSSDTCSNK